MRKLLFCFSLKGPCSGWTPRWGCRITDCQLHTPSALGYQRSWAVPLLSHQRFSNRAHLASATKAGRLSASVLTHVTQWPLWWKAVLGLGRGGEGEAQILAWVGDCFVRCGETAQIPLLQPKPVTLKKALLVKERDVKEEIPHWERQGLWSGWLKFLRYFFFFQYTRSSKNTHSSGLLVTAVKSGEYLYVMQIKYKIFVFNTQCSTAWREHQRWLKP